MSPQDDKPVIPKDPKRDPVMLSILRWLMEDKGRTLPTPDDEEGIQELARAIGKSPEYIRALMAWSYGDKTDSDTFRILK
jgi:hypothetical protein